MKHLVLLAVRALATQDQRLLDLADWMGVSAKALIIEQGGASIQRLLDAVPGQCCLAMSAETLTVMHKASLCTTTPQQLINACRPGLLVYGCSVSIEQQNALSWLTAGAVCGIGQEDGADTIFSFPREARNVSRQLAGLNFSRRLHEAVHVFELHTDTSTPDPEVVIAANDRPMCVRMDRGPCQVFLSAGPTPPDLDEPLRRDHDLKEYCDRLIPALLFIRYCFRESAWHSPASTARLIIDDPLLTGQYGFLDYSVLVNSMRYRNYGTSIAYIPWNHWRTSKRVASQLLGEPANLSICVHGCDHTNKEFEAQDPLLLVHRAGLALQRMESHRSRTGTEFERVMVFPQGRFSVAATRALRATGYLAAVNTTCFPTNSGPDDFKVRDLLRPVITRYDGFPIFQRRYPRHLFDFAFDLLVGRPVLVVEHHEYFRDGVGRLEQLIAELYQMEPDLTWPTLTSQLTRCCQMRGLTDNSTEVRFFTSRFQLIHREAGAGRFLLSKHEPDSTAIQKVLVDGNSVPFYFENGYLRLELPAEPGRVRNIEVLDRPSPDRRVNGFGMSHNARVILRRGLSEFRDNTLSRHTGLLRAAQKVARRLKVTGDA